MRRSPKKYFVKPFEGKTEEVTYDMYMSHMCKQFNSSDTNTFNRMLEVMQLKYIVCGTTHLFWVG